MMKTSTFLPPVMRTSRLFEFWILAMALFTGSTCTAFQTTRVTLFPLIMTQQQRLEERTNSPCPHRLPQQLLSLQAAGMGIADATTTGSTSTKKGKKQQPKRGSGSGGMGMGMGGSGGGSKKKNKNKKKNGATTTSTKFDANASLLRLEKKYDEMLKASTKALHNQENDDYSSSSAEGLLASEMVVTVRAKPQSAAIAGAGAASVSAAAATADWVPVGQLILHPHSEVSSEYARAAISLYCRELALTASLGSKIFDTIPRRDIQYAIEPIESWYKYVYDTVVEQQQQQQQQQQQGKQQNDDDVMIMTKVEAREVLELDNNSYDDDMAAIKQAYRRKSFQWHPDRLVDSDLTTEERDDAAKQYHRIQKAYETLQSGIRQVGSSWYASLGGKERTELRVIEDLMNRETATSLLDRYKVQSAIVGLSEEVVQTFVSRNQAAATAAAAAASATNTG